MKKIMPLLFLLFPLITCDAQDLIITTFGDSIECKITSVNREYVNFTRKEENKTTRSLIPAPLVSEYFKGDNEVTGEDFDDFRFALSTGLGYRTGKISNEYSYQVQKYLEGLRKGFTLNTEGIKFFNEFVGMGLRYSFCKSGNSDNELPYSIPGVFSGDVTTEDKITVQFLGPSFHYRSIKPLTNSCWLFSISAGIAKYKNMSKLNQNSFTISGKTCGMTIGLEYDHLITQNTALGFEISMPIAVLQKITLNSNFASEEIVLDRDNREGLSRIDFTVGLRFY